MAWEGVKMSVLFSPIGNSDPWRNDRDGAMLNIVRTFQPEFVRLFFTKSIWEDRVNQFGKMIPGHKHFEWQKIIRAVSPDTEVEICIESIDKEHDYDSYKDIFHDHVTSLMACYPDQELLINVSSGTPQMGATLCLEYVAFPDNKRCLQVSTPANNSNANSKYATPDDQEVDLEVVNEEEAKFQTRCTEINILSFRETIVKGQLSSLIDNYDYNAAFFLVTKNPTLPHAQEIKRELKVMSENIQMHRVFDEIYDQYSGRKNEALRLALTHCLLLNMRFKRRDYAEVLIRVKSIAEFITEQYINKRYPKLIQYRKYRGQQSPFFNSNYSVAFTEEYRSFLWDKGWELDDRKVLGFVNYFDMLKLLEKDGAVFNHLKVIEKINDLRNGVAHRLEELAMIDGGQVDKESEVMYKLSQAVKAVNTLLAYVYPHVDSHALNYFDNKNNDIKALLVY
jgi:CRISPR type III-A/MTUBE-associated protein Csm6